MPSYHKSHFKKKKKDPRLVCIFLITVIFINVWDTAGVVVLWNLWLGFKGYDLNSFFCYILLCVHWVKRLKMFSSIKYVKKNNKKNNTGLWVYLLYCWLKKKPSHFDAIGEKLLDFCCSAPAPLELGLFSPALAIRGASKGSAAQSLREANHCHVLPGQTSLGQKPIQNCQKELLLNVRGICTHPERDFNALTEWISLPAHQILSVNRQPPHGAMPARGGLASAPVQLSHGFHGTMK